MQTGNYRAFRQHAATFNVNFFTRTTLASAGISCRRVSVCHISQVAVLLKGLNARSRKQRHMPTPREFSDAENLAKLKRGHPRQRRKMNVRYVKIMQIGHFRREALST